MPRKKRPWSWRLAKFLAMVLVFYLFVLPLIPGFQDAIDKFGTVQPDLLVAALGLQFLSLLCYSFLTKSALGHAGDNVSVIRLFRIQLSTKALGNVLPGGSAASSALGYRLLTISGVSGPNAGFALATAGIGSALVLNVIVWVGLIVSIPARGVNAVYGTAAIAGVLLMGLAAMLIFGLVEGQGRAERLVRKIARKIRIDENRAADVLEHLGERIEAMWVDKQMMQRVVMWAVLNWVFDAMSLWVFLRAFGATLSPLGLIVSFGLANILSVIPITPGGLGIVEGVYIPTLIGFGLTKAGATLGVLTYRVAQFWIPIAVGWITYLSLRYGPWSIDREHLLQPLGTIVEEDETTGIDRLTWVERNSPLDRTGQFHLPQPGAATPLPRDSKDPKGDDEEQSH